jgi:membrane-bound lytic murein transglycosylase
MFYVRRFTWLKSLLANGFMSVAGFGVMEGARGAVRGLVVAADTRKCYIPIASLLVDPRRLLRDLVSQHDLPPISRVH